MRKITQVLITEIAIRYLLLSNAVFFLINGFFGKKNINKRPKKKLPNNTNPHHPIINKKLLS